MRRSSSYCSRSAGGGPSRALVHASNGWVRTLIDGLDLDDDRGPLAAKVLAFEAAKRELTCTDTIFTDFVELQDYLVSCHSTCAPADYLWAHLKCRPGEEEADDADDDDDDDDVRRRVDQLELDAESPRAPLEARLGAYRAQ